MDGSDDSTGNGFKCNICYEPAEQDPIVTPCGHLYCWPCLYTWLHNAPRTLGARPCPVCRADIEESRLIPLYGIAGSNGSDPRQSTPRIEIPERPAVVRRDSTANLVAGLFCTILILFGKHILLSSIDAASDNLVKYLYRRFDGSTERAETPERGNASGQGGSNHN